MLFEMMDWILLYMNQVLILRRTTIEDNFEVDMIHSMLHSTVGTSLYVTYLHQSLQQFGSHFHSINLHFSLRYLDTSKCPTYLYCIISYLIVLICKICIPAVSFICPTYISMPYPSIHIDFSRENRNLRNGSCLI